MEESRKLATIQKIKNLIPIENADNIVLAEFENVAWKCIVLKSEFEIGNLAIYCEIDSVLPERPEFEFLRKRCWVDNGIVKGFRIRTIKLRQQLSQGICFNLQNIPIIKDKFYISGIGYDSLDSNQDVTQILGIIKYDSPETNKLRCSTPPKKFWKRVKWELNKIFNKNRERKFPSFVPKTDEIRIQNYPESFTKHKGENFYLTEKLDGSSSTFAIKNNKFYICSRNLTRRITKINRFFSFIRSLLGLYVKAWDNPGIWEEIAVLYNMWEKIKSTKLNIAIQGEIVGPGIQGNKYNFKDLKFYCFAIYDIDREQYFDYKGMCQLLDYMKLPMVPIIEKSFTLYEYLTVEDLLNISNRSSTLLNIPIEGLVFRLLQDSGKKISFKVINNEFLLKYKE